MAEEVDTEVTVDMEVEVTEDTVEVEDTLNDLETVTTVTVRVTLHESAHKRHANKAEVVVVVGTATPTEEDTVMEEEMEVDTEVTGTECTERETRKK